MSLDVDYVVEDLGKAAGGIEGRSGGGAAGGLGIGDAWGIRDDGDVS